MRDTLSHHEMSSLARLFTHVFRHVFAHVIAKLIAHVSTRGARASGRRRRMAGKRGGANRTGPHPRTAPSEFGFSRARGLGYTKRYSRAHHLFAPVIPPLQLQRGPCLHNHEPPIPRHKWSFSILLQTYSRSASPGRMKPVFVVRLPVKVLDWKYRNIRMALISAGTLWVLLFLWRLALFSITIIALQHQRQFINPDYNKFIIKSRDVPSW